MTEGEDANINSNKRKIDDADWNQTVGKNKINHSIIINFC